MVLSMNQFVRWVVLMVGLFITAMGVALSVRVDLGTMPIASVPYVYSLLGPLTMGEMTVIVHAVFIGLQIVLLRRAYNPVQLLQFPVAIAFGAFTDIALSYIPVLATHSYPVRVALCVMGCLVVAFGVFLQVKARVIYLSAEGLLVAICAVFKKEFGKARVVFDCSLVSFSAISSLLFYGELKGVREGTILAALLVGTFVRLYASRVTFADAILAEPVSSSGVAEAIKGGTGSRP